MLFNYTVNGEKAQRDFDNVTQAGSELLKILKVESDIIEYQANNKTGRVFTVQMKKGAPHHTHKGYVFGGYPKGFKNL